MGFRIWDSRWDLGFGILVGIWDLGFRIWDNMPSVIVCNRGIGRCGEGARFLVGIWDSWLNSNPRWDLGFGILGLTQTPLGFGILGVNYNCLVGIPDYWDSLT